MGSSSAPRFAPNPAIPTNQTTAVQEAAAEAARTRRLARGFRSTILTKLYGGGQASPGTQETLGS